MDSSLGGVHYSFKERPVRFNSPIPGNGMINNPKQVAGGCDLSIGIKDAQ